MLKTGSLPHLLTSPFGDTPLPPPLGRHRLWTVPMGIFQQAVLSVRHNIDTQWRSIVEKRKKIYRLAVVPETVLMHFLDLAVRQ